MNPRFSSLFLVSAIVLGACSSESFQASDAQAPTPIENPIPFVPLPAEAGAPEDAASPTDYTVDFVPGDPSFVRDPKLDVANVSKSGERRSHNVGRNCLGCHQEKGPGKGRFVLAGTLYGPDGAPLPNVKLKLFARAEGPDGGRPGFGQPAIFKDEVRTIDVDAKGNFFTTEALPAPYPASPLYPQFFAADGVTPLKRPDTDGPAQMGAGVTTGGCNFCHSASFTIKAKP
jgi:hypothetical protein